MSCLASCSPLTTRISGEASLVSIFHPGSTSTPLTGTGTPQRRSNHWLSQLTPCRVLCSGRRSCQWGNRKRSRSTATQLSSLPSVPMASVLARAYRIKEQRSYFRVRALSILVTVGMCFFVLFGAALLIFWRRLLPLGYLQFALSRAGISSQTTDPRLLFRSLEPDHHTHQPGSADRILCHAAESPALENRLARKPGYDDRADHWLAGFPVSRQQFLELPEHVWRSWRSSGSDGVVLFLQPIPASGGSSTPQFLVFGEREKRSWRPRKSNQARAAHRPDNQNTDLPRSPGRQAEGHPSCGSRGRPLRMT